MRIHRHWAMFIFMLFTFSCKVSSPKQPTVLTSVVTNAQDSIVNVVFMLSHIDKSGKTIQSRYWFEEYRVTAVRIVSGQYSITARFVNVMFPRGSGPATPSDSVLSSLLITVEGEGSVRQAALNDIGRKVLRERFDYIVEINRSLGVVLTNGDKK